MMEEVPGSQLQSGQLGPGSGGINMVGKQNHDEHTQRPQYSIPGILHFIQHEWARFEMERSQWEVERAELQARIAFLQGERKGQENLKNDLVRRIKMLEYALKQERAKYHKLKYGTELNQGDLKPPVFDDQIKVDELMDGENIMTQNSVVTWKQGRQLLRQYLQEIGYTDTIIDVRSARVRSMLGLSPNNNENEEAQTGTPTVNGEQTGKRASESQGRRLDSFLIFRTSAKKIPTSIAESALLDSEASVLDTFDFLASESVEVDDEDENLSDGEMEENISGDDEADERIENKRIKCKPKVILGNESMAGMDDILGDADTEEALAEFDFLGPDGSEGAGEARSQGDGTEWEKKDLSPSEEWGVDQQLISKMKEQYKKERKNKRGLQRPKRSMLQTMLENLRNEEDISGSPRNPVLSDIDDTGVTVGTTLPFTAGSRRPLMGAPGADEDALEALGLGELAGLTVTNEAEPLIYDVSATKEAFRKTWNAKYTLRSHFDGVRALAFHPIEPVLITASEDQTLKFWNLQKTVPAKKTASLDVEPIYTFRAHVGPVLCLAMSATGEQCFSGGLDSTIKCWNIPSSNTDPYDSFDPGVLTETLTAHTDAVWGLSIHSTNMKLLSCSADGTVKLWLPQTKSPLLNTFTSNSTDGNPTSVDFVRCDPAQMVTAYTSSNTIIFDLETGKSVIRLESKSSSETGVIDQINRVISHPTLPITITAHEDRHIRFFDNNTGKLFHSMVAHLDAVTSLAIDPNGLYLLSGSHDCSIRLWNLETKTCVQEITSHRKKFDESIFDVAFHPSKPFIASAGADALAKVFV